MKNEKIFWGVLLILGGIFLIVNKLGFFPGINGFNIILSLFFVAIIIKSIIRLSFAGILFPLAFLAIIFDEPLGITAITPWTVLIAALLGTIGLSMIFHSKKTSFHKKHKWHNEEFETIDIEDESHIRFETSFGSSVKYINTDKFVQANLECSFGAMSVYFDNATMANESAVLNIQVSFAGMEIYIPRGWTVEDRANVSFGNIEHKNKNKSDAVITNTLILTGDVSFSGVEIIYI